MASVKVAVRVRPFNQRERDLKSVCIVEVEGKKTRLINNKAALGDGSDNRERAKDFTFDFSYWSHREEDVHFAPQVQLYEDLGTDVVSNALQGYNACVFAYGQTGSGKTFTMMGSQNNPGLIPRICEALFSSMAEGREAGTTYKVEVSYLEIYNERVKDLLRGGGDNHTHSLRVREHPKQGPYVQDLSSHIVHQYSEIQELMARGNSQRTTASTHMNDTSSRSHAIFTVTFIQAKFTSDTPLETRSKLHLVDLAGSERADATGATGKRLKEGAHINKSLVTLGSVISALAEQAARATSAKAVFIPYRDSVLTWLLKDSLGGNSKTMMIATISPADVNYGETLSTLRYANRAKNIINKPTINEDPNVKLIRELREEIQKLKTQIHGTTDVGPEGSSEQGSILAALSLKQAKEKELTDQWTERWKETHTILQEQKTLGLRKAGQGVVLDSERPHLVLIDDNLLTTGVTLYHLNDGTNTIGAMPEQDIRLEGLEVLDQHCTIHYAEGAAVLEALGEAQCWVNSQFVDKPTKLTQGCVVVVGGSHMFRYNDPQEAARLRREGNKTHLNLSRLSFLSRSATDLVRSYDNLSGLDTDGPLDASTASRNNKISRIAEPADLCEMSTQTSLTTHSQPSTPIGSHIEAMNSVSIRKSSLTLPLAGDQDEARTGTSSIGSTPASDTFYTATSFLSPGDLTSPVSPLPLDNPHSPRPKEKESSAETGALFTGGNALKVPASVCIKSPDKDNLSPMVSHGRMNAQGACGEDVPGIILPGTPNLEGVVNKSHLGAFLTSPIYGDFRNDSITVEGTATSTPIRSIKMLGGRLTAKNLSSAENDDKKEVLTSYSYKGSGNESSFEVYSANSASCYTDAPSSSPLTDNENQPPDNNNTDVMNGNDKQQQYIKLKGATQKAVTQHCDKSALWHSGIPEYDGSALISPQVEIEKASKVIRRLREGTEKADISMSEQIRELESLKEHYCNLEEQLMGQDKEEEPGEAKAGGGEDGGERLQRPTDLPLDSTLLQEDRLALLIEREVQRRVLEEVVARENSQHNPRPPPRRTQRSISASVDPWTLGLRVLTPSEVRPYTSMSAGYELEGEMGNHLYQSSTSADDLLLTPAPLQTPSMDYDMSCGICVCIPGYEMRGAGAAAHWEYEVKIAAGHDSWTVFRRYRRFRELHMYMCHKYGRPVEELQFPPRRLFGNFSERVVAERRGQLEVYLQQLIVLCVELEGSPLFGSSPSRTVLAAFSPFFQRGVFESSRHTTS